MRKVHVFGLDDFGLTLPELVKLGATKIELRADLRELRHARVAIQIEGQTKGSQTYADRFVAVKATSSDDAKKKLRPEFRAYAEPYLNPKGEMVHWALEEIVDVYDTDETELDGVCVEVYSILKRRRMRPELVWMGERQESRAKRSRMS